MITNIKVENFKIHKSTSLDLSSLNIFTGINSSGKSSIIQALLLLRQNYEKQLMDDGLSLNGDLCNIGFVDDAICFYGEEDTVRISLSQVDHVSSWAFRKNASAPQKDFLYNGNPEEVKYYNSSLFTKDFQYIGASRLAPQESYPLDTVCVEIKKQISREKGQCELVVHYLDYYGSNGFRIDESLKHPNTKTLDLKEQVSAWESEISKGVNVVAQKEGKGYVLKYGYKNPNTQLEETYSATNVGIGLSYALPIVVSLLTAKKGSLIIIENPEIHLHPGGQAALAKLIVLTAQMGAQIVVETHSDHIINGILVATKRFEENGKGIDKDKVKLYYFEKKDQTQLAEVTQIKIIGNGNIDNQPKGFFDQIENDLSVLLGF